MFAFIENRLCKRVDGWGKKILSQADKEILLKSVTQALPTYTMSLYYFPISFCQNLERICNKYWRESHPSISSGMHGMYWD